MGRRYEAEALYEDEYQEDECTRAAVASIPSYDDAFEDRTRSARESYVALEGLAQSAERPRAAFVAPAELEGERSPAMRARRRSYVEASELYAAPARPERRSQVARSERIVRRQSFVATSERADFASSAPVDEVTTFHDVTQGRRVSQHPVRESTYAPEVESSDVEEISARPAPRHESVPPSARSRPDYQALQRYLFEDVSADSPEAAAMSEFDRSVSMQTPVAPILNRAPAPSFRPAMPSIRPEIAPAARVSHLAFRPPMMTGPQLPPQVAARMGAPAPHDSFVDSSWIVPTPPHPGSASPRPSAPFKMNLSFVAAALTALAALAVMLGAIVFVRSDDAPTKTSAASTMTAALPPPAPVEVAPVAKTGVVLGASPIPVAPPVVDAVPAVPEKAAAPRTPAVEKPAVVAEKTELPKKKKPAAPVAAGGDDEDAPAPPVKKKPSKASDRAVEQMLAELGEQQLRR